MSDTTNSKKVRDPLFHLEKRIDLPIWKVAVLKIATIFIALFVSGFIATLFFKANPITFVIRILKGNGIMTRPEVSKLNINKLVKNMSLLLIVAIGLVPAFKMKFWNLGGNGQILMGCLATTAIMVYMTGKVPTAVLHLFMFIVGVAAGMIWAVIPALFKSFWNTNESLFTLMMNYIAEGLVTFFLSVWVKGGSGTLATFEAAKLPVIANLTSILPCIFALLLTLFLFVYMKYHKHGYEIAVVGDSSRTAKYIGINVKTVTIRTLLLSGGICGLVGFLVSGANGTLTAVMHNGLGFTAILVAWLAEFNPLVMVGMSALTIFVTQGVKDAASVYGVTNDSFANIIIGVFFFLLIAVNFFITYKIVRTNKKQKEPLPIVPEKQKHLGGDKSESVPFDDSFNKERGKK